jgi:hypothetical protein
VWGAVAPPGSFDSTAPPARPGSRPPDTPRAKRHAPAWIRLDDGRRVLELPSTHSLGQAARSLAGELPPAVHVHFHDYELLDRRRRAALSVALRLLARRRRPVEPGEVDAEREVTWADVCAD